MGDIYVLGYDASVITMTLNACGDCDDLGDCLDDLDFNCGYSSSYYQYSESYYGYSSYSSCDSTCGCSDFISGVSYSDEGSDSECYSPSLTGAQIAGIVGGAIGGVILLIICCCCICRSQKKAQQARAAAVRAAVVQSTKTPVMAPATYTTPTVGKGVTVPATAGAQIIQSMPVVKYDANGQAYIMTPQGTRQNVMVATMVPS